ncbi:MAG TPA: hypothetical protein VJM15_05050 [Sphingomicrobium sp.]|nr:hypothetical protein [Sphingomicrobium sp.]
MKNTALAAAVLAFGLAACTRQETANNAVETDAENAAVSDTIAAMNDATANANAEINATGMDANATTNAAASTTNAE